jgi:phage terminase large subunit-like protein
MSLNWMPPSDWAEQVREEYGLTCVPRWATPRNFDRRTYGPKVSIIMGKLGTPPMPWQRYVFDTALEVDDETGNLAYNRVGLSVVRQQGKTAGVLGLTTWRLLAFKRQAILYAAQTRNAARKKLKENFLETIGASPLAYRFNKNSDGGVGSLATGQEGLLALTTRSRLGITANTLTSGHGEVLDLGLADEYFSAEDDRLQQAWGPAMLTRQNAQFWWMSAAGTERSVMLNGEREAGQEMVENYWATGAPCGWAYFEWSPPDDAPREDPDTWFSCMPALCPSPPCRCDPDGVWHHTTTLAKIAAELEGMKKDLSGFDRAYLNRTRKYKPAPDVNVPVEEWSKSVDAESRRGEELSFFIDTPPVGDYAAIGVFSPRADGKGHVELVAYGLPTSRVVDAVLKLKGKYHPVAIGIDDKSSAGRSLIDDLTRAGLNRPEDPEKPLRGDLFVMSLNDMTTAAAQIARAIREDQIRHTDQVQINKAIGNTRTRPVGDAWAFGRKQSGVDISPFITVTGARYVHLAWKDKIVVEETDPGAWWV